MKVLVVGGGGREHALVWKLSQSSLVSEIYCSPGNAGIGQQAVCVDIHPEDTDGLLRFARDKKIDFTVVGPEAPLVAGLADAFREEGLKIFGPGKDGAALEGSKSYAKYIMKKYGVPTANSEVFYNYQKACRYLREEAEFPCVLKADGLAAGKGVSVAGNLTEALRFLEEVMKKRIFGEAGNKVVIEEYLEGEEISIIAMTDGKTVLPLASARDYKRIYDGDKGPNTGGMGAFSPVPIYTPQLQKQVEERILKPVIKGMSAEGVRYRGALYAGLIITENGPKVLEFNVRFGDPETQPLMVRMKSDLLELMLAVECGRLEEERILWFSEAAVCVVLASEGYPGRYEKGKVITSLDKLSKDVYVFHAGTRLENGRVVTSGGRVLSVTARGKNLEEARKVVYRAAEEIQYMKKYYRKDIGKSIVNGHI